MQQPEHTSALSAKFVALMEDIDFAFHYGLSRESPHASSPSRPTTPSNIPTCSTPVPAGNHSSLSGLLNALYSIGAQGGRVLFATTNKYSSVGPALCRPDQMDLA